MLSFPSGSRHEAKAQTGRQILQSHPRAHTLEARLGHYPHWVVNVKNPASRLRRAEQVAEQLLATMEAELELPPILKLAFARDPRAYQGWQSMTLLQRRHQLLGIFYYRSPEARDRRVARMLEAALAVAERKAGNEE